MVTEEKIEQAVIRKKFQDISKLEMEFLASWELKLFGQILSDHEIREDCDSTKVALIYRESDKMLRQIRDNYQDLLSEIPDEDKVIRKIIRNKLATYSLYQDAITDATIKL